MRGSMPRTRNIASATTGLAAHPRTTRASPQTNNAAPVVKKTGITPRAAYQRLQRLGLSDVHSGPTAIDAYEAKIDVLVRAHFDNRRVLSRPQLL
jgi:hypothetical protein